MHLLSGVILLSVSVPRSINQMCFESESGIGNNSDNYHSKF